MYVLKNIGSYSKKTLAVFGSVYLLNFFMSGSLSKLFLLNPSVVTQHLEFWRLFTFVLAPGPVPDIILFAFVFLVIAPHLDDFFKNSIFLFYLIPLIFLQGVLLMIIFWDSQMQFAGMGGVSFFVLTVFTLSSPAKKIKLPALPSMRTVYISLISIAVWILLTVFNTKISGSDILVHSSAIAGFGIAIGTLTFIKIYLLKIIFSPKREHQESGITSKTEEMRVTVLTEQEGLRRKSEIFEDILEFEEDPEFDEDTLNKILDKVSEHGMDSLSFKEYNYLREYSRKL